MLPLSEDTRDFRGLQSLDPDQIAGSQFAQEAHNIEFLDGAVRLPRPGMGRFYDVTLPIEVRATFEWINSSGKYIMAFGKQGGSNSLYVIRNPDSTNPTVSLVSSGHAGESARFAKYGEQLFMTIVGADQFEADLAYVFTIVSGSVIPHVAFPFTLGTTFNPTGSFNPIGFCNYGERLIGLVPEYTDGHLGRAFPDNTLAGLPTDASFVPIRVVVENIGSNPNNGGSILLSWGSLTWPSNIQAVHVIMAPVTNSRDYRFVPNGRIAVVPGGTQTLSFTISVDDATLLQGSSAIDHLFYRTHGPGALNYNINPYNVFTAGSRVFWFFRMPGVSKTISTVIASVPKNPQGLLIDTGSMVAPDGSVLRCGVGVTGGVVLAGDNGVYEFTDTGDPVGWPHRVIDASRGCLTSNGIVADKAAPTNEGRESSASKYWILLRDGLIHTSGYSINQRSMTERARGIWGRINWKNGNKIQVVDVPGKFNIYIMAPLDGANDPTHILVVHYYRGKSENQVDISLMQVGGFSLGAFLLHANYNPNILPAGNFRDELMVFSRTANAFVLRQKEVGDYDPVRATSGKTFTDDAGAIPYVDKIPHVYVTGVRPQGYQMAHMCGPYDILVKGEGTLQSSLKTNPQRIELDYEDIQIPTGEPRVREESFSQKRIVRSQGINIMFEMKNPGEWCELSALKTYHSIVGQASRKSK